MSLHGKIILNFSLCEELPFSKGFIMSMYFYYHEIKPNEKIYKHFLKGSLKFLTKSLHAILMKALIIGWHPAEEIYKWWYEKKSGKNSTL